MMLVIHLWWHSALSFFLFELVHEELLSNLIECFTDVKRSFCWGLEKHSNLLLLHPCFCIFFSHLPLVFKVQVCTHEDKNGIFGGIVPCLIKPALKRLKRGFPKVRERIPCNIINEQYRPRISIKTFNDWSETFLTGCIPDL